MAHAKNTRDLRNSISGRLLNSFCTRAFSASAISGYPLIFAPLEESVHRTKNSPVRQTHMLDLLGCTVMPYLTAMNQWRTCCDNKISSHYCAFTSLFPTRSSISQNFSSSKLELHHQTPTVSTNNHEACHCHYPLRSRCRLSCPRR